MNHLLELKKRNQSKRGAATVEFAVVLPILLVVLFGILEFGRAMYVTQALSWSAREGARMYAETKDAGQTRQIVRDNLTISGVSITGITNDDIDIQTGGNSVTVTVQVGYNSIGFVTGFIPALEGVTLKGQAVMSTFGSGT